MSKKQDANRHGTLTMRGSVADAVTYAAQLGCEVHSARLDSEPAPAWLRPLRLRRPKEERIVLLEVGASSDTLNRVALAQASRRLVFAWSAYPTQGR